MIKIKTLSHHPPFFPRSTSLLDSQFFYIPHIKQHRQDGGMGVVVSPWHFLSTVPSFSHLSPAPLWVLPMGCSSFRLNLLWCGLSKGCSFLQSISMCSGVRSCMSCSVDICSSMVSPRAAEKFLPSVTLVLTVVFHTFPLHFAACAAFCPFMSLICGVSIVYMK